LEYIAINGESPKKGRGERKSIITNRIKRKMNTQSKKEI